MIRVNKADAHQQSVDAVPQQLHDVALVPSSVCVRLLSDQHNLC